LLSRVVAVVALLSPRFWGICWWCISARRYAVRPIASFPGKKRFGNKSSKFVEQRRLELMEYFRVTFMSADLATFWYDTLRELQYQQQTDLTGDDVYNGGD